MKRNFRIFAGMLLLAIPLCINAQNDVQQQVNELKGKVDRMPKISGFVQGMYQANLSDKGELLDNTLRMRRVRMSVEGNLSKTVS
ncbi:MAG: hypothetical protein II155_02535, partial [Clostridia bacterium]|nr:hypothetical protein [Clostridia bacterium]